MPIGFRAAPLSFQFVVRSGGRLPHALADRASDEKNGKGEVLGVLQLINCKRNPKARLTDAPTVRRWVRAFPERAVRLALSLASQAAVALREFASVRGHRKPVRWFRQRGGEGHRTAGSHDLRPFPSRMRDDCGAGGGHRSRNRAGTYGDLRFSREQMKEIRYASLLHDFGKVGVREEVLIKAKKTLSAAVRARAGPLRLHPPRY